MRDRWCYIEHFNEIIGQEIIKPNSSGKITLSTDSRTIASGDIYIGLVGEKFDGGSFSKDAIKSGATFCVIQNKSMPSDLDEVEKSKIVVVPEILDFFHTLARKKILKWAKNKKTIIGLTGSNGKTTTKEMLFHLLSSVPKIQTYCTKGNFNNHIGVPLTIFELSESDDIAILEMGTNHPGEIEVLADIGSPTMGIITNIGDSHLEFLGSRDGVFVEKRALFDKVMKLTNDKGYFLLTKGDPYLDSLPSHENVERVNSEFLLSEGFQNTHITGVHNYNNFSLALALSLKIFPDKKDLFIKAGSKFIPKENRSSWMNFGDSKIFLDAYNANPSSMSASLDGFFEKVSKDRKDNLKIAIILGDMNELGADANEFHEGIGKELKSHSEGKTVSSYFVGRYGDFYNRGNDSKGSVLRSVSSYSPEDWKKILNSHDYVFIKGSRSLQLESILAIK